MKTRGVIDLIARIRDQAHTIIADELRSRGIDDVLPAHGRALAALYEADGPVPIKAVTESAGRVKSTITVMIRTLEKNGYVTRMSCPDDKRSVLVSLTEKGRRLFPAFQEISELLISTVYGEMPEEEREVLMNFLNHLDDNLNVYLSRTDR
ncbi:MAG: MarR family transcriptional regulator [Deltaproteobacteria bacterium]|nr:MarR family transcriptional regulator [Candidatus Zymogenaceae bacterium]